MRQTIGFILFVAAAFILTLLPGGLWSGLLTANLRTGIAVPWSVPAALALLWLAWLYAGGWGPPKSTSAARRRYRRAKPAPGDLFAWALVANALSLTALAGLWIVLFRLVRLPGAHLPDFSAYPLPVIVLVLVCAGVVGGVSEEVGIRGYLQGALERRLPWPAAVVAAALVIAPGHALTQGFVWPTLVFYMLADVAYGVTAYLTDSILPGAIAHAVGLFVFFAFIWPRDAARPSIALGGPDLSFWLHVAQVAVFGPLAVGAFAILARKRVREPRGSRSQP
ncbi:CPBP family intramembrane glutamic endopeptidase [Phenylobacterium sp.]|uniref:CPBP family intramembrane glutamic endopeptidase n=1 Tax=Phenylobacterium sp. TaxID=1871053 RepID=UPI002E375307|nr:CPBP family intramembrane glutamic endopeptidase [Phenylobacterium sp.]HEX4711753.1 CPBP family intramembrane glutamic endopeptidase [Phenylobacterium sp.]